MIDAIYVMYHYNKTDNFIYQKDREAKKLERDYLVHRKQWSAKRTPTIKKDTKFDGLRRKLGGA